LSVGGHYISGGGTPHVSVGGAAGGGSVSISGDDTFGTVTVTTGSPSSSGMLLTISFASAFGGTPHVVISPANAAAAGSLYYTGNVGAGSFQIDVAAVPSGGTTYTFEYFVGQ
jgi:hypothetical protein